MRRFILASIAVVYILPASFSQAAVTTPLLTTTWGQDGATKYALYSPGHWRLGCWSTAFAQILYYHRLAPHGSVSYNCTTYGYHISENLNSYSFDWNLFVNSINSGTPQASVQQVAKYSYYASVVIEKDFGTGDYVLSHLGRANALEDHYNCETSLSALGWSFDGHSIHYYTMSDLEGIVEDELNAGCPVMLHIRNTDSDPTYHAVALDGWRTQSGNFQVHVNMGHEGSEDGWYNFAGTIGDYNDTSYREIVTIRPVPEPSTFVLLGVGVLALLGFRRVLIFRSR
jgi:hypothetical protein